MKEILTIGELLLRTTVLINIKKEGTLTSGTGFLFYSHENIFLVTNRHVVEKSREIELKFYGQDNFLVIKNNFITSLQYDIAICILNNIPSSAKMLTPNQIPNRKQTENFDAIEDILFIGYPTGIYDTYNNSPIARKGITATPISLNYEGKYQFLIDASIFPGSSGSPVFLIFQNINQTKDLRATCKESIQVFLLGIITEGYSYGNSIKNNSYPPSVPIIIPKQMIDLGVVIKSSELIKLINDSRNPDSVRKVSYQ
ncbi:serine protease [Akkermansia muciniphila]|uniref:S1 family peptidase n=1 Tax=Akkermansia muciniphila TaxID=239935 RepID=UPI00201DCD6E|nr:serine protease [Akkermansia muciniphila]MCL6677586.1 serine protease [Akkermansia muciniphila]